MILKEIKTNKQNNPQKGTILVVTLFFIVLLTLEVSMVIFVMQRSVGEKAAMTTSYNTAKDATGVAMQRLKDDLYAYIQANGTTNVATDFAKGGANDIDNVDLMAYDAEDSVDEDTGVDISAWVQEKRGYWYHIIVRAKFDETDLLADDWVKFNDNCMSTATVAGLTTIQEVSSSDREMHSGRGDDDYNDPAIVDPTNGRVFWGKEDNNSGQDLMTWHESTGLSTLKDGCSYGGCDPNIVDSSTGRVFMWGTGNVYTWHESTGLSVITDSNENYLAYNDSTNILYMVNDRVRQWHITTGLSTVSSAVTSFETPNIEVPQYNGRLYFDDDNSFFTWNAANGLSTIMTGSGPGSVVEVSSVDGRVFFSDDEVVYTWHTSSGLSTLATMNDDAIPAVSPVDGRVFMGSEGTDDLPTWHSSTGLSTIVSSSGFRFFKGNDYPVFDNSTGRIFFGGQAEPTLSWHITTGLSTIWSDGGGAYVYDNSTDALYFGDDGSTLRWNQADGYTTILTGSSSSNVKYVDENNNRVLISENGGSKVWVWHASDGLSTVLTSGTSDPYRAQGVDPTTGAFYFGDAHDPGHFWRYMPAGSSDGCPY